MNGWTVLGISLFRLDYFICLQMMGELVLTDDIKVKVASYESLTIKVNEKMDGNYLLCSNHNFERCKLVGGGSLVCVVVT